MSADDAIRRELRIAGVSQGTPEWNGAMAAARAGLPTSAQLRQAQADLTAMQRKRDEAREQRDQACALAVELLRDTGRLRQVEAERDALRLQVAGYARDWGQAARERDAARRDADLLTEAMPCGWCDGIGVAPAERFGRDADGAPVVDEDGPCPQGCDLAGWLKAERNDAADVERERDLLRAELVSARTEATQVLRELADRAEQLLIVRADNAKLRARLDRSTDEAAQPCWVASVIVARDGGRDCARCDQEIRRGEAYELMPGVDELQHIHCPGKPKETSLNKIVEYAIKLVATGAESIAEDDLDEDGEFEDHEDARAAADLGVSMAQTIGRHPYSFLAWLRSVDAETFLGGTDG